MKGNTFTVRGELPWSVGTTVSPSLPVRIILDNMNPKKNWIVSKFEVWPTYPEAISHSLYGPDAKIVVLATEEAAAIMEHPVPTDVQGPTVRDNRQIAWSSWRGTGSSYERTHLAPDHLIVNDLWLNAWVLDSGTGVAYTPNQPLAYMIELTQVTTTYTKAIFALIQSRGGG